MSSRNNNNWWDGRDENSFFPAVYKIGNDSLEGNLEDMLLDLEQRTLRESDMVESYLELPSAATILDCPCGSGRHSIELAKRGYDVTGVDLCPQFVVQAKKKSVALPKQTRCNVLQGDMRFFPKALRDFDVIINMFFSFGFFYDDDNYRVLREFFRVIRSGGKLLLHTDVNPDRILNGTYGDRSVRMLRGGGRLLIDEKFNNKTKRLEGCWTIDLNNPGRISRTYSVRIYEHDEMITLLRTAGFSNVRILFPVCKSTHIDKLPQEVVYVATK